MREEENKIRIKDMQAIEGMLTYSESIFLKALLYLTL